MSSSLCPNLSAQVCPVAPLFTSCHQVSTYDHSNNLPRRHQPNDIVKSTLDGFAPTACAQKLSTGSFSGLDVCGSAKIACTLEACANLLVDHVLYVDTIEANLRDTINMSANTVELSTIAGDVIFTGQVAYDQSPFTLNNVGAGVGLVNPGTENGPDFELLSLVSPLNSVTLTTSGLTVGVDTNFRYPSMIQGDFHSALYSLGSAIPFVATAAQYSPAFVGSTVVIPNPSGSQWLVNAQVWIIAPFGGATYYEIHLGASTISRLVPFTFPNGKTYYDTATWTANLTPGSSYNVSVTSDGAALDLYILLTLVRLS